MKTKYRILVLALAVAMALSSGGCVMSGVDGLYSLPQLSEEYLQLEGLIAQRIAAGSEYAAPVGGSSRQSVQLQDLDGDGTAEAIAFLADENHMPTVCVYCQNSEGEYYLHAIINGEGSAVSRVEYADVNGDGAAELILCWQISGDIHLLTVYSPLDESPVILSADCTELLVEDLDGDGIEEILDLRLDYGGICELVCYEISQENVVSSSKAELSGGITQVERARMGTLSDGTPALFVESLRGEESLITDVFAVLDGETENITMTATGVSGTQRNYPAYAADINADRAMELPDSSGDLLTWYSLDANGRKTLALTTYHDYESGWYLTLPEEILSGLSVSRRMEAAGETAVTFSRNGERELVVYTLTGENRLDRAATDGRFILRTDETTVYAAELLGSGMTEEDLIHNFNLIYSEWQTGDL